MHKFRREQACIPIINYKQCKMVINTGLLITKEKTKFFYSAIRLYIADYFIRLYLFILKYGRTI